jgi:L-alanine-DL-glutamate epimerase-like enolase superfamily enzyme
MGPGITAVLREFNAALAGEYPSSIDRIMRRLLAEVVYCSPGLVFHALAGIETALLDLIGKRCRMPMWQLLGGKYRDRVAIYADCHAGEALESIGPLVIPRTPHWAGEHRQGVVSVKHHGWDAGSEAATRPADYGRRAAAMAARGFRTLKFDIDVPTPHETDEYNRRLGPEEIEYAVELVRAVRDAVGPGIEIAVDCHWNYGVESAVHLARALERFRLAWLEDPVPPDNIAALARVQAATSVTVATGENQYFRSDFERLITEAGLRVLAPDLQKVGFWEGRKVADLADMHHTGLAPHNISGPVGTLASVHLCAAIPNFIALEWHAAEVPFFDALVKGDPLVRDGMVRVPDAPGLGAEPDLEVAYRYRKLGEPFFE